MSIIPRNKKDVLLEFAKEDVQRSELPKALRSALYGYTNSKSGSYDEEFSSEIRVVGSHWFWLDKL